MRFINFFGTKVSCISQEMHLELIEEAIHWDVCSYITYSNIHTIVLALHDENLRSAINNAMIVSPDGMPIVKIGRFLGANCLERCAGPDMIEKIVQYGIDKKYKHFFYGSTEEVLFLLEKQVTLKYPDIEIIGMYSPPFRPLKSWEDKRIIKKINDLSPDLIWVGLGAPKQELWMREHQNQIKRGIMLGVGAAFEFQAKTIKRAPVWMQRLSLEWLFRLLKEPKRLWKRYLVTNCQFVLYLFKHGVKLE